MSSTSLSSDLGLGRVRNTLLAQQSPQAQHRRRQLMRVASDQFAVDTDAYQPNALWKRDRPNRQRHTKRHDR